MVSAFAILALAIQPKDFVSEFFPLVSGSTYTYEENYSGVIGQITDTISANGSIGKYENVTGIGTKIPDMPMQFTYYKIANNEVQVVAYIDSRPLINPMPIIVFKGKKTEWNWTGNVDYGQGEWKVKLKGKSNQTKPQSILGTQRIILEVDLNMEIQISPQENIKLVRRDTFASGLGLVTTSENTDLNDFKTTRTRKLISFQLGSEPK